MVPTSPHVTLDPKRVWCNQGTELQMSPSVNLNLNGPCESGLVASWGRPDPACRRGGVERHLPSESLNYCYQNKPCYDDPLT